MSMISAQCDELRDTADKLDKTSAVSTPWIHCYLTPILRRAADTIWELRNDHVKLRDENERMRMNANPTAGELRRVREAWEKDREKLLAECQHSQRLAENLEAGEHENARLRKLIGDLYQCSRQCGCDRCGYKDGCAMFDRMAQMGVEVDG